eukprot:scaffold269134_cov31-Tisochrysis_lutea.AAC.1
MDAVMLTSFNSCSPLASLAKSAPKGRKLVLCWPAALPAECFAKVTITLPRREVKAGGSDDIAEVLPDLRGVERAVQAVTRSTRRCQLVPLQLGQHAQQQLIWQL